MPLPHIKPQTTSNKYAAISSSISARAAFFGSECEVTRSRTWLHHVTPSPLLLTISMIFAGHSCRERVPKKIHRDSQHATVPCSTLASPRPFPPTQTHANIPSSYVQERIQEIQVSGSVCLWLCLCVSVTIRPSFLPFDSFWAQIRVCPPLVRA